MTKRQKEINGIKEYNRIDKVKDSIKIGTCISIKCRIPGSKPGECIIKNRTGIVIEKYDYHFIVKVSKYKESFQYSNENFEVIAETKKAA